MHIPLQEASEKLAHSKSVFVELFTHGTLTVELYKPHQVDNQAPHDRDELYVIISGEGEFIHEGTSSTFSAGDVLFVKAGQEHRFFNFTDDFATWVFFYGPVGGE